MKYVLMFLLLSTPALAADSCNRIDVKVDGMVCDFCARSLEKIFGEKRRGRSYRGQSRYRYSNHTHQARSDVRRQNSR